MHSQQFNVSDMDPGAPAVNDTLTHPYMHETSMTTSIMSEHSSYDCPSTGDESFAMQILLTFLKGNRRMQFSEPSCPACPSPPPPVPFAEN